MIRDLIKSISRREWLTVALVCAILIIVTTTPYVYGWATTPEGMRYTGIHYLTAGDTNVYIGMIRAVQENEQVMVNLYTSEPQKVVYINALWYGVGLMARMVTLDPLIAFHLARILLGSVFVFLLYAILALFFSTLRRRMVALCVTIFSSGLGAFFAPILYDKFNPIQLPVDTWMPEVIPFLTLYHTPHLIASLTLILVCIFLMHFAFVSSRWKYVFAAGVCLSLLTWFHPFNTPTVLGVTGVYLLVLTLKQKKIIWRQVWQFIFLIACSLPPIAYLLTLDRLDPTIAAWRAQNDLPSPSPFMYLIGFASVLPFALVAWLRRPVVQDMRWTLLTIWVLVSAVLIYSPVNFQRRMAEGMYIPLAILAVYGMCYLIDLWKRHAGGFIKQSVLIMFAVIFFPMTNFQIAGQDIYSYQTKKTLPYYLTAGEVESLTWLREHTPPETVIMSSKYFGNFIPAYTLRYVYIGHGPQTLDLWRKLDEMVAFYSGDWSPSVQKDFLHRNGIDYVVVGQMERELGATGFEQKDFLETVSANDDMQVYRVL